MSTSKGRPVAAVFPSIQRNSFNPQPCSFTQLPFVADVKVGPRKKRRSFWVVPQVHCYAAANATGEQFAADFIQLLKQNPEWAGAGTLGRIARDMYCNGDETSNGVPVGFWSLIERVLIMGAQRIDVYGVAAASVSALAAYATDPSSDE